MTVTNTRRLDISIALLILAVLLLLPGAVTRGSVVNWLSVGVVLLILVATITSRVRRS